MLCRDFQDLNQTTFYAPNTGSNITDGILYLIIMVPEFMGSSALENLLASSPSVTTMCQKTKWQCEPTWNLVNAGILVRDNRWQPDSIDWYAAYEYYENISIWDDMTKPIRIEKAPPNIVKYKQLMEYFHATNKSFMFISMKSDRCYVSRHRYDSIESVDLRLSQMEELEHNVPPQYIVSVNYTDMITNTNFFVKQILDRIPQLQRLDITSRNIHARRRLNHREEPLYYYIRSENCVLKNHCHEPVETGSVILLCILLCAAIFSVARKILLGKKIGYQKIDVTDSDDEIVVVSSDNVE